jgi:hypothetical protein
MESTIVIGILILGYTSSVLIVRKIHNKYRRRQEAARGREQTRAREMMTEQLPKYEPHNTDSPPEYDQSSPPEYTRRRWRLSKKM